MPRWVINFKTITDFAATTCELYFLEFLSGHDWAHLKVPKVRFFNGFFCLHLQANIYVIIFKECFTVWRKSPKYEISFFELTWHGQGLPNRVETASLSCLNISVRFTATNTMEGSHFTDQRRSMLPPRDRPWERSTMFCLSITWEILRKSKKCFIKWMMTLCWLLFYHRILHTCWLHSQIMLHVFWLYSKKQFSFIKRVPVCLLIVLDLKIHKFQKSFKWCIIISLYFSDKLHLFHSMAPELWLFEYIYDLRRTRQYDKADQLEQLYTSLQKSELFLQIILIQT